MNTTLAAAKARRTVATIRTWCRRGVIGATKQAGKWVIDQTSLEYRISLDKPAAPKPLTAEDIIAIGGRRWTKAGHDRVYLNDPMARWSGLELSRYKSGNICGATLDGERISNSEGRRLAMAIHKLYFDIPTGKLFIQWAGSGPRDLTHEEIAERIFAGVRASVAAL